MGISRLAIVVVISFSSIEILERRKIARIYILYKDIKLYISSSNRYLNLISIELPE